MITPNKAAGFKRYSWVVKLCASLVWCLLNTSLYAGPLVVTIDDIGDGQPVLGPLNHISILNLTPESAEFLVDVPWSQPPMTIALLEASSTIQSPIVSDVLQLDGNSLFTHVLFLSDTTESSGLGGPPPNIGYVYFETGDWQSVIKNNQPFDLRVRSDVPDRGRTVSMLMVGLGALVLLARRRPFSAMSGM